MDVVHISIYAFTSVIFTRKQAPDSVGNHMLGEEETVCISAKPFPLKCGKWNFTVKAKESIQLFCLSHRVHIQNKKLKIKKKKEEKAAK
jgi:hypothetical protein